jgi:outer membrane receptor protein involved in Fe transport
VRDAEVVAVLGATKFNMLSGLDIDFSPADVANLYPTRFRYDQQSAELRASGNLPAPFGFGEIESLVGVLFFDSHLLSDSPLRAGRDFAAYLLSPAGYELATGMPPPGGVSFANVNQALAALGVDPLSSAALLEGDGARFFMDQDLTSKAFFGQLAWHATEQWTLSFGARFTYEDKKAHLRNECFDPGAVCGALGVQAFDLNRERNETDFSPKVTLQYFPFENLSLFATRGQGFKSGGFNNFNFTTDQIEVEPEKTVSWEAGAKGTLLDGQLSYAATFFNMDVKDLQLQGLRGAVVVVRNAASARSRGVELESQWLTPWEPLSIRGSGAWTDGRFKDFQNAPAPASSGASVQDLSGRGMPFAPKTQFSVTPKLAFPFRNLDLPLFAVLPRELVFTTAFDVSYRSASYLDIDLDPNTRQPAYTLVNGRIGISNAEETLSLTVSVDNILDTDAFEYATDSILYPGGFVVMQEFQRTFGVQMRYGW